MIQFCFFVDILFFSALSNHRWLNKYRNLDHNQWEQTLVLYI